MKITLNLCLLASAVVLAAGCEAEPAAEPLGMNLPAHAVTCRILVEKEPSEQGESIEPGQSEGSAVTEDNAQGDWIPVAEGSNAATELASIEGVVTREIKGKAEVYAGSSQSDVTGDHIAAYHANGFDIDGNPTITFALNAEGSSKLMNLTWQNRGRRLAIIIDGKVWAVPQPQSVISEHFLVSFPNAGVRNSVAARLDRLRKGVTTP